MKVITEAQLRERLRTELPETYAVPAGTILSPAAREYLKQHRITILEAAGAGIGSVKKPEHMTHLSGSELVPKDHKRIRFRGKLDSREGLFVLNQTMLEELGESQALVEDLQDLLVCARELMRCEVMKEPFKRDTMIGLSHQELREQSHDPVKYYQVRPMILPDRALGKAYALLNQLRCAVRETEVEAAAAFHEGSRYVRPDLLEALNRMSSAVHILMCRYLAGRYEKTKTRCES